METMPVNARDLARITKVDLELKPLYEKLLNGDSITGLAFPGKDGDYSLQPEGVVSPKLSRILSQKGAVSPPPVWIKKFEPTVTQNPMTLRRFFIVYYRDCKIFR
ncbi:hypothetical protein AVEN_132322-1 [Araneus ventricosus]|uniref:Uncharacterized protein n=1 Tax=Araneus ventricosus TaxID=182803 RepID=A0A4Y2NIQ4_ARAVE|nr:hypothetical protein AVEN_132322-1 [Araneus ventricosus]